MTSSSSNPLDEKEVNAGTMISPMLPLASSSELMRRAFDLVTERVLGELDLRDEGYVVAVLSPRTGELTSGWFAGPPRGRVIPLPVGRHKSAPLCLAADDSLSLRHAVLFLGRTGEGDPVIRLLDLRSGLGMFDVDGAPHQSIVTNGPLRMRVGNSVLFAIPTSALLNDGLVASYDEVEWPDAVRWLPESPPEQHIMTVSKSRAGSTMVSMPFVSRKRVGPHSGGAMVGALLLECDSRSSLFEVDAVAIRTGVLVGRYPRCDLNEENAHMSQLVSRIHALFIAIDEKVYILDTGSTNGLLHQGRSVDLMALPDDRMTSFELGDGVTLSWRPS